MVLGLHWSLSPLRARATRSRVTDRPRPSGPLDTRPVFLRAIGKAGGRSFGDRDTALHARLNHKRERPGERCPLHGEHVGQVGQWMGSTWAVRRHVFSRPHYSHYRRRCGHPKASGTWAIVRFRPLACWSVTLGELDVGAGIAVHCLRLTPDGWRLRQPVGRLALALCPGPVSSLRRARWSGRCVS